LTVSLPPGVQRSVLVAVREVADVVEQTDSDWLDHACVTAPARIRFVGSAVRALEEALGGRPDVSVWGGPVTEAGRVELLPFVREQAISMTAHRFGTPQAPCL
jgi:RHH-type proline utilization regulon transcriptional repressor/proline dehydrogenase/delta 1-pyrroline-5-carboxylate dehydrogenase